MSRKQELWIAVGSAAGLCGLGLALAGPPGAWGALLGLVAIGLSMMGTWALTEVFARSARSGGGDQGWIGPVFLLLLKLPALYVAWLITQRLGPPAPTWFLLGLALVYLLTAAKALCEGLRKAPASDG